MVPFRGRTCVSNSRFATARVRRIYPLTVGAVASAGAGARVRLEPLAALGVVFQRPEKHHADEHEEAQELERGAGLAHGVAEHRDACGRRGGGRGGGSGTDERVGSKGSPKMGDCCVWERALALFKGPGGVSVARTFVDGANAKDAKHARKPQHAQHRQAAAAAGHCEADVKRRNRHQVHLKHHIKQIRNRFLFLIPEAFNERILVRFRNSRLPV